MADMIEIKEWIGLGPHKVLEKIDDAAFAVRRDGLIAYANEAAMKQFGYSRAQMVGQPVSMLLPEDRRAMHSGYIAIWFKHPHARPMGKNRNIQGQNANGDLMDLDIKLSPLETDYGVMALALVRPRGLSGIEDEES